MHNKKILIKGKKATGARNNYGHITVRGRKKGAKKSYRVIDFKRNMSSIANVKSIEYDPNRSSYIALIQYSDGIYSYILSSKNLQIKDRLISSNKAEIIDGNCLILKYIPLNIPVHNIELKVGKGGQISRSAGSFSVIISKKDKYAFLKMKSGEIRRINIQCRATIGIVSNNENKNNKLNKAGDRRFLGFKPKVRGVAKNPIDHPHGGGEGKTSGGRHPVTKYGICTKGFKTRKNKSTEKYIIKHRLKK
jgi:large subunit ribosomal protein L2